MRRHRLRLVAATLAAVIALPTAFAFAHAEVKSRSPKKGSTVHHAVREVSVTFDEAVITGLITVKKGASTVALKSNGLKTNHHAILRAIPKSPLTAGTYTVNWRATADDGHHEKGTWTFKVS